MLNDPIQNAFANIDFVALALSRNREQWHAGLLFKVNKKVKLRHQQGHLELEETEADEAKHVNFLWTKIDALSALNKRLIANRLAKTGKDKIPYGVGYKVEGRYVDDKTLKYIRTEPGYGLSCSAYIVAVLDTMGFKPFDMEGWNPTEEDIAWQKRVAEALEKKHPDDSKHFAAEKANAGIPRVRPDHVVGAAKSPDWPIKQPKAEELGKAVKEDYNRQRK